MKLARNREFWDGISRYLNPLTLIFFLAAWLRFGHLFEWPLSYDEHSSLMRIGADSYAQMLELGVWGDGHPAGLYTFLRAYDQLFGDDAWVVKLPFLLMGMATVLLSYLVGKDWFSESTGWLTAAVVGLFIFPLQHSLISRMYTPGLLFCLLAAWAWTQLVFKERKPGWKWAVILGLTFVLAVYTHYFAALFCVLLWLGGWLFVGRDLRNSYLLSAGVGTLLFLPHLPITLYQLSVGGIPTVLSEPGWHFFINHFGLCSNFSWILGIFMAVLAGYVLLTKVWHDRKVAFALFLWLGPMVVGGLYSHLYSPVLQDRVLLFSLPFLGIFLGSALPKPKRKDRPWYFLAVVFLVVTYSLETGSERYALLQKGEFDGVLEDALAHQESEAVHLLSFKKEILEYYRKKMPLEDLPTVNPDSLWTLEDYQNFIRNQYPQPMSFGWTTQYYRPPVEVHALLRSVYGQPSARENYPAGEYFFYGGKGECEDAFRLISELDHGMGWRLDLKKVEGAWHVSADQLWGLVFERQVPEFVEHCNDRVFFSVDGDWSATSEVALVVELMRGEQTVYWKSVDLGAFEESDSLEVSAHIGLPFYNVEGPLEDLTFKAYLWNKSHESLVIRAARIWSDGGNAELYGINRPWIELDDEN